ncbi:hypothetical protein PCANC_00443 [Puccinia coronata f. sp. avenae]|uniref:Uncharacterized protein n=1 Tax=Puccinia coronata f. sp. avenae TaxID=200324 RepID=A0A2N5W960_9BASI|nr:hypothetical protein PCANC_00443 [Puccinia coronata f. sp. avenae]
MPHAYNRRAHGEQACRRARQACRACTPVWKACKACTPFGQACRLCTPVGSRKPLDSRGLREPRYPYKGTLRTLIRVLRTLSPGSRQPLDSRGLREPAIGTTYTVAPMRGSRKPLNREAYVSQPRSVPLELTWARVPKPATNHTNPSPPPNTTHGPTTAVSPPQALLLGKKGPPGPLFAQKNPPRALCWSKRGLKGPFWTNRRPHQTPRPHIKPKRGGAFCWSKRGLKGPFLAQKKASSDPQTPHQAQKGPAKPHLG